MKKKRKPKYTNVIPTEVSDELLEAFNSMCARNMWPRPLVLEYLIEYATKQDHDLAWEIHKFKLRKERGQTWRPNSGD